MKRMYDHVLTFVWVKDFRRALAFYTKVLGFKKVYESEAWAELAVPELKDSFIALNRWAKKGEFPRNNFITLRVDNLDEFEAQLLRNNVNFTGKKDEFLDEGQGLKMFKFFDSEGNVLTAAQIIRD